ncbi:MAG: oxygen-independent coproporphyrinogen III oxidase [Rhodospirillales bacterium 20-64-7]|nr:MAG: oxygen-independent coproporphyrinogen III oxidase [Rhodospirillales bacterium 20-64-7]
MTIEAMLARYDGRMPRYTSYPTAPHFSAAVGPADYESWLADLPRDAALSLYVHVPFCDRLCLYCGCNTAVVRQESARRAYAETLMLEIAMVAARLGRRARVTAVHWGGGTPTTLPGDVLIAVMDEIRLYFEVPATAEIAIELDPTAFTPEICGALRHMGVTRASLGVQDFDPAVQAAIGRAQSLAQTLDCAAQLRRIGVAGLNLDLIYGLPNQTVASVARTAVQALTLQPDRLAVFGYAHVPWIKRHQALLDAYPLPGPGERFAQAREIAGILARDGFRPIGLDHYARPADTMAQAAARGALHRNFQGYTTDAAGALLGFGASAIGRLGGGYVQNAPAARSYMAGLRAGRLATAKGIATSPEDRLRGAVIERLMCDLKVDLAALAAAHGAAVSALRPPASRLQPFAADGLLRCEADTILVTEAGRPFLRNIAALFDRYLAAPETERSPQAAPRYAAAV